MAVYQTKGIIIGRHNFGEADRIMVILTPEKGIIRGVAKGVRRIKSKLAGHLEMFCESNLMLAEGRNLDVVTSARLIFHPEVTNDYAKVRLAYLIAEMISRLTGEEERPDLPDLYNLASDSFRALESEADSLTELWFKLRLLDLLGYRPELGACMVCQTSDPSRKYRFNSQLGGIVDENCSSPGNQPISTEQIKFWRILLGAPLTTARRIEGSLALADSTMPLCNAFYDHTFGQRFRSAEVLA